MADSHTARPAVPGDVKALRAEVAALRRQNAELLHSEARLRQIMDALPALAGYVDLELRIVYANRLLERWYERPLSELVGMQLRELFSAEHYRSVEVLLARVLSGEEVNEEREIRYPDGVTRYVNLNYVPHRSGARVLGYFFLVRDITQRHRAEEALKQSNAELDRRVQSATARLAKRNRELREEIVAREASEARYRVVSELMSDLVYTYHIGADRRMVADWYAGRLSEEFSPQPTSDGHHRLWAPIVHPEDRPILEARIDRLLRNEPSVDEFRVIDAAGRERWLRVYGKPEWDEEARRIVRITVAAQDITEQRKAEQKFENTRAQLAEALESMSDGFMLFDEEHRLVTCNQKIRELFEKTAPRMNPGARFEDLLRISAESGEVTDAIGRESEWVRERLATYPSESGASEVELSNGRWILATDRPTRAGGVVSLRTDITERKRAEENLRRQEAELAQVLRRASMGEMASALAHELSQPLAAIAHYSQGSLRRLRNDTSDLGAVAQALEKTCDAAQRAKGIVRHVSDFVRRTEPVVQREDLVAVIRGVCALVESSLRRNGVRLELQLPDQAMEVAINRIEIEQVLFNLIRNGIDAMLDNPWEQRFLELRCARQGSALEVRVSDAGEGIDARLGEHIFEPYVSSKDSGLGMGLSISRTIVEAHGGRLWFTPRSAHGTAFHFSLPDPGGGG